MKDNDTEIREYTPQDQERFRRFYVNMESTKRTSRVLHALAKRASAKLVWQAGLVGILGIHLSRYSVSWKSSALLIAEMLLWSAGVGIVLFKLICREYDADLKKTCDHMATVLGSIREHDKDGCWIAEKNGEIVGTVALKYESGGEGKIGYLTGLNNDIRQMLIRNAFRFGRTKNIGVISKWKGDMKWSESAL